MDEQVNQHIPGWFAEKFPIADKAPPKFASANRA